MQVILTVDMNLYCMALLLEIAALLRLRYTDPGRDRPYRIPAEVRILGCHVTKFAPHEALKLTA